MIYIRHIKNIMAAYGHPGFSLLYPKPNTAKISSLIIYA